jgi:hypothetical protein
VLAPADIKSSGEAHTEQIDKPRPAWRKEDGSSGFLICGSVISLSVVPVRGVP